MASPAQDLGPVLDKDGVRLTVDDAIATVTLTNPAKRNAQSPALWRALTEAGRLLPGSVRVVVLRGEGKSFSAGLDRQAFTPEGFDGEPSFIDLARGAGHPAALLQSLGHPCLLMGSALWSPHDHPSGA